MMVRFRAHVDASYFPVLDLNVKCKSTDLNFLHLCGENDCTEAAFDPL